MNGVRAKWQPFRSSRAKFAEIMGKHAAIRAMSRRCVPVSRDVAVAALEELDTDA